MSRPACINRSSPAREPAHPSATTLLSGINHELIRAFPAEHSAMIGYANRRQLQEDRLRFRRILASIYQ